MEVTVTGKRSNVSTFRRPLLLRSALSWPRLIAVLILIVAMIVESRNAAHASPVTFDLLLSTGGEDVIADRLVPNPNPQPAGNSYLSVPYNLGHEFHGSMVIDDSVLAHDGAAPLTASVLSFFDIEFAPYIGFSYFGFGVSNPLCGPFLVAFIADGKVTGLCGGLVENPFVNPEFPYLDLFGSGWAANILITVPDPDGIHFDIIDTTVGGQFFGGLTVTEVTPEPTPALLLASGLAGLACAAAWRARRRTQRFHGAFSAQWPPFPPPLS
jgi:hypothetical protein